MKLCGVRVWDQKGTGHTFGGETADAPQAHVQQLPHQLSPLDLGFPSGPPYLQPMLLTIKVKYMLRCSNAEMVFVHKGGICHLCQQCNLSASHLTQGQQEAHAGK